MIAVMKKELKNYFYSPIGYVVIGIFLLIFSAFFYLTSIMNASVDLTNLFYCVALYGLMFMIPLLTMWSFAGERKSGTEQLIMTSPVSMLGVVLGKFISAFLLVLIPVIFTTMYFGILSHYQIPDVPTYLTSMLGFLLLSMLYISFRIISIKYNRISNSFWNFNSCICICINMVTKYDNCFKRIFINGFIY